MWSCSRHVTDDDNVFLLLQAWYHLRSVPSSRPSSMGMTSPILRLSPTSFVLSRAATPAASLASSTIRL